MHVTLDDITAEPQFIREATYLELRAVEGWLKVFKNWHPSSS